MRLQPSDGTCLSSAKLSANQPAQWHTLAILHTLQMPHSPVFLRRGSALTRKIAFQNGELIFLRNWAYVYRLAEKTDGSSKVAGKFGVAPLPGLNGPGVSTLGGHNLAIGTNAANKGTAADFIKFMSSEEVAKADTLATGQAHVNRALYSDPDILKKFPHFPILLKSIETAKPRPKVVNYGDATLAMQDAATSALQGQVPPDVALSDLQSQLESLTK